MSRERNSAWFSSALETLREDAMWIIADLTEGVPDKKLEVQGYIHRSNWSHWRSGANANVLFRLACTAAAMAKAGLTRADFERLIRFMERVRDTFFPITGVDRIEAIRTARRADAEEDVAESDALLAPDCDETWARLEAAKEREVATELVALSAIRAHRAERRQAQTMAAAA